MKRIVTLILKQGDVQKFHQDLAISLLEEPVTAVNRLLACKNQILLQGEEEIKLVRIREKDTICYSHDWRVKGDHYMCRDCKIPGIKEHPFSKVKPKFEHAQYKDCSWTIKIENK